MAVLFDSEMQHGGQGDKMIPPPSPPPPPRWWVLMADWCNWIAAIVLFFAFMQGMLIFNQGYKFSLAPGGALQILFCLEGALWAVGLFFMVQIMANAGNTAGTIQFSILFAGGIFFSFSGLVAPSCILSVTDVFSAEPCAALEGKGPPKCFHAFAHFGITCFMIGCVLGMIGVKDLPKSPIIGPFWGSLMYFLGAWTIGIFQFWGPCVFGHVTDSWHPANSSWQWWFAMLGAIFLFAGASIFLILDGSYKP